MGAVPAQKLAGSMPLQSLRKRCSYSLRCVITAARVRLHVRKKRSQKCKEKSVLWKPIKTGRFIQGRLNIGEPITIPIIHKLKQHLRKNAINILDCSPGASCTVVQTIDGCDYCILVTEPTPFGLHDLKIAVALVRKMSIAFGVVLNKANG